MIARTAWVVTAALLAASLCYGQTWQSHPRLVMQVGDIPPGTGQRPVIYISGPVQDGYGTIGLIGHLDNGDGTTGSFLWVGDHIALESSDLNSAFFHGREFGIGRNSWTPGRPFGVLVHGGATPRELHSHRGLVLQAGGHGPGLPGDAEIEDIRNLQVLPNGTLFFNISYFTNNQKTAQYVSEAATADGVRLLFKDGDVVDGMTIRRLGLAYAWHVSDDGRHHTQVMSVTPQGGGTKKALYHNGSFVLVTGDPTGSGESWLEFSRVATNNLGYVLMAGTVTTATSSRSVLAINGNIVQREGDVVDGIHLTSSASVASLNLDNDRRAIYLWARQGIAGPYAIFFTPNVDDFGNTRHVVSEGADLDLDGDGSTDAVLHRFRFDGGPTIAFGPNKAIYIAAEIRYGSNIVRGVLQYPLP